MRPVTGATGRGSSRAVGLPPEGRDESCRTANGAPPDLTPAAYGGPPWPLIPPGWPHPPFAVHVLAVRPGAPKARP